MCLLSVSGPERRINLYCLISNHLNGILLHVCKSIPEGKACCLFYLGWGDLLMIFQWCLNLQICPQGEWDSDFHQQPGGRTEPSVSSRIYFQLLSLSVSLLFCFSVVSFCNFSDQLFSTCCFIMHFARVFFSYLLCQDRYDCGSPAPFNSPA